MKTCPRCGTSCADNDRFCPNCGQPIPEQAAPNTNQGPRYEQAPPPPYNAYQPGGSQRPTRSVAMAIILSIVTCGIYGIYWLVVLNDEVNALTGDTNAPSGIVVFLLSLITCGIYGLYWAYVMGRKVAYLNRTADSGIINLIIALFGFQIINLALFQDAVNRYAG